MCYLFSPNIRVLSPVRQFYSLADSFVRSFGFVRSFARLLLSLSLTLPRSHKTAMHSSPMDNPPVFVLPCARSDLLTTLCQAWRAIQITAPLLHNALFLPCSISQPPCSKPNLTHNSARSRELNCTARSSNSVSDELPHAELFVVLLSVELI